MLRNLIWYQCKVIYKNQRPRIMPHVRERVETKNPISGKIIHHKATYKMEGLFYS
ncbi:hypothetical protein LguiA_025867 [Lonicera macranthoides]